LILEKRPLASHAPLTQGGFVALMAGLMALNALAIDIMLPALPEIGLDLGAARANDRQAVITAYLVGFGVGQFLMGPLSDRFGRKPLLLTGLALYVAAAAAGAFAPDFALMLAARAVQGFGSAAPRIIVTAVVRDCYEGRTMARVTSYTMMVFMAAPVVAPSLGQAILLTGPWRWIFLLLAAYGLILIAASAWRLPETLPRERRRALGLGVLWRGLGLVFGSRQTVGYALSSGVFFGALFGFIASAQQVLGELYALGPWFPLMFGALAALIAGAAFVNARLVERLGMRRLSHGAVIGFTLLSAALAGWASVGQPPLIAFAALIAAAMTLVGLVFANFSALAMEPQATVAGLASSMIGGFSTLIGASIGFTIGQAYDGTIMPMALGYVMSGAGALAILLITERGRLFAAGR
jgi:DHA1 family bicyclomycin/chloramphenicol resistance-like MFS transporter